ncbi:MAG: 2-isopropylmalate synthase [Acidobacteria bacterium]|nr:MAG: 2-isopropylmalate synthase [Acidobacteriota bacterium]
MAGGGRVAVFDTTLRDGEQSPGCSMNAPEKLRLARQLERLGVDVIEAGFPVASPGEWDSVRAIALELGSCTVAALCRAREGDIASAARALEGAPRPRLHVFLATSGIHLKHKLGISPRECVEQAAASVRLARSITSDVEFSAEDACRTDYGFLREVVEAVREAGAGVVNLPDTVGYALPEEVGSMIGRLVTINGIGERAGNTSLEEFVMALRVRREALGVTTGVRAEEITRTSQLLSSITGIWPQPNKAIVGRNAFAHEAGIHQHGVLKNPLTYEIMTPASVGLGERSMVLGKHSGRHAVESRLVALGLAIEKDDVEPLTARVKELADRKKFVYDEDLLALVAAAPERRTRLARYQVVSGNELLPTATVEIEVDGARRSASAVGNGPLDAALKATDAALGLEVELLELHTRAVTAGKDALAEVIVRVRHAGHESTGQAASTDSIEASLKAYLSAIGAARRAQEAAA